MRATRPELLFLWFGGRKLSSLRRCPQGPSHFTFCVNQTLEMSPYRTSAQLDSGSLCEFQRDKQTARTMLTHPFTGRGDGLGSILVRGGSDWTRYWEDIWGFCR